MMNLYLKQYCKELIDTVNNLTSKDLNTILTILQNAYKENKKIYMIDVTTTDILGFNSKRVEDMHLILGHVIIQYFREQVLEISFMS